MARFVAHPVIDFGSRRIGGRRPRLGLARTTAVYHRPSPDARRTPTVRALRSQTSRFRFPSVGRIGRVRARRSAESLGSPRARRA